MEIKQEMRFILSNGEAIKDEKEAIERQRKIDFGKAVWAFANKHAAFSESVQTLGEAILENKNELAAIFSEGRREAKALIIAKLTKEAAEAEKESDEIGGSDREGGFMESGRQSGLERAIQIVSEYLP